MWGWSDAPGSCRSESMTVQVTGSYIGRGALNGHLWYRDVSETTFSRFGDVLLIPSYIRTDLKVWQRFFSAIGYHERLV